MTYYEFQKKDTKNGAAVLLFRTSIVVMEGMSPQERPEGERIETKDSLKDSCTVSKEVPYHRI